MLGPRKTLMLIALCVPAVAACKADITTDVYVRDARDVMKGEEKSIPAPARVTVAFPGSAVQCRQRAGQIVEYMRGMFPEAKSAGCENTGGMNVHMAMDVRVPIVGEGSGIPTDAGAAVIARDSGELSFKVDDKKLEATVDAMKSENPMVSLDSFTAGMNVLNDTRDAVNARVYQVFVDGQPVWDETYELGRRDDLEITLSDVGAALVRDGFDYPVAKIDR